MMIRSALRLLPVLTVLLAPAAVSAQTDRAPLARVFVDTARPETTITAIARPDAAAGVGVRIPGDIDADAARRGVAATLEQAAAADVPVWLVIAGPASATDAEGWRQRLKDVLAAHQPSVLEITFGAQPPQLVAFAMQIAATEARVKGRVTVALGGTVDLASVYSPALAPYVDAVAVSSDEAATDAARMLASVDPGTPLLVAAPWTTANDGAMRYVTDALLRTIGTAVAAHAWPVPDNAVRDAVSAVTALDRLLGDEVTELDPSAAQLHLTIRGDEVSTRVPHRLLFDGRTLATLLVYWGDEQTGPLGVRLSVPTPGVPAVYDVLRGRRTAAEGYVRNDETATTEARLPLTGRPMLVDFTADAAEVFAERSGVEAARQLTAEEIIARHRQQQARQDAAVDSYIANARLQQHFRPTVTDPGYDVVTENRYFVDREGIEWEELSFSVNGSKWGSDRPPFPLLQPEKVLSLPLQLRFDEDYRYRLAGTGRTGGYDCYLIEFEPVRDERSLYRGTLWIDKETFARVRVQAVQTRLGAPIVSNEEDQVYRAVTEIDDAPVFLLGTLTARQIVLIAGRNLLLEKVASFDDFRVNAADFAAERAGARASERVMYRETDRGLRYFVKEGETRVVSERQTTSAKAMAIGVTVDPSYDFPLPILGINYLDFEFRNPQTQLAVLFAGVLAAGNVQRPRVGDSPFDASIDFFAIAVPSNDRLYDGGGDRTSDALLTWPLTAGGNLGWQVLAVPEARRSVSVPLRRFRARPGDGGDLSSAAEHHDPRARPVVESTAAAATALSSTGCGTGVSGGGSGAT